MITASWPPVARVGVRRPLRLARRLKEHGWTPVVMTPTPDAVFRKIPTMDPGLSVPDVDVHRVSAWFPSTRLSRAVNHLPSPVAHLADRVIGASLFPDQYREWSGAARTAAANLEPVDLVWVTGGPFGIFLSGSRIARDLSLPLVLDYRDPWTTGEHQPRSLFAPLFGGLHRLEASMLNQAAGVSFVNDDMLKMTAETFSEVNRAFWRVIPNGFDPMDVPKVSPTSFAEPTLLYAGACYASRSMAPILQAVARADDLKFPPFRVRIHGELDPEARRFLDAHPLPNRIDHGARLPSRDITAHMLGAAGLLLIIGEGHRTALSAKVFDYLQAERPIVGYGPADASARALIDSTGVGVWASTPDELLPVFENLSAGEVHYRPQAAAIRPLSADAMAERTALLLDDVVRRQLGRQS